VQVDQSPLTKPQHYGIGELPRGELALVILFHPRRGAWADHFLFRGVRITGTTPTGRATVHVLARSDARRLELWSELPAHNRL
jgi:hypothetical protein